MAGSRREGRGPPRDADGYIDFDDTTTKVLEQTENPTTDRCQNSYVSGTFSQAKKQKKGDKNQRGRSTQLDTTHGYGDDTRTRLMDGKSTGSPVNYSHPLPMVPGKHLFQHPFGPSIIPTLPNATGKQLLDPRNTYDEPFPSPQTQASDWRGLATNITFMDGIYEQFRQIRNRFTFNEPEWSEQSSTAGSVSEDNLILKQRDRTPRACVAIIVCISVLAIVGAIVFVVVLATGRNSGNGPTNTTQITSAMETVTMEVKIENETFTPDLGNTSTEAFRNFSYNFCNGIDTNTKKSIIYKSIRCEVNNIRQGSILVKFTIVVIRPKNASKPTHQEIAMFIGQRTEDYLSIGSYMVTNLAVLYRNDTDESVTPLLGKIGFNGTCLRYNQCITLLAFCDNNKCACSKNRFHDNTIDVCSLKIGYNDSCSSSNQCLTPQAVCNQSKCACPDDHLHDNKQNVCLIIDCGVLPSTQNGSVSANGTKHGQVGQIRCNEGYEFPDGNRSFNLTCKTNGTWGFVPECIPVNCSAFQFPNNTKTTHNVTLSYKYQNNITLTCATGYNLTGAATVTCQPNKEWTKPGMCELINCSQLGPIANSTNSTNIEDAKYGEAVTVVCEDGFVLNGDSPVSCNENGTWPVLKCEQIHCPNATTLNNSDIVNKPPYVYQDMVNITCDQGYTMTGSGKAACLANASWEVSGSCEQVVCKLFTLPSKLAIVNNTVDTKEFMFQDRLLLNCSSRYTINGSSTISCQDDGTWSTLPTCLENCFEPTKAIDDALYAIDAGPVSQGSVRNVTCVPGLTFAAGSETSLTCKGSAVWEGDPDCVIPGTVAFSQDTYNVSSGNDLQLVCNISGYPNWQKISLLRQIGNNSSRTTYFTITPDVNDNVFNASIGGTTVFTAIQSDGAVLSARITNVTCADVGLYACVAVVPADGEPLLQQGDMTVVQIIDVAFNGSCCFNGSQCRTQDAVCHDNKCVCDETRVYDMGSDTCLIAPTTSTTASASASTTSTDASTTSNGPPSSVASTTITASTSISQPTSTIADSTTSISNAPLTTVASK